MLGGTIAKNENGVVGVILGIRMKDENDKGLNGGKGGMVSKRQCYTGITLSNGQKDWEGKRVTPLTRAEIAAL